jgi:hypothetical protein
VSMCVYVRTDAYPRSPANNKKTPWSESASELYRPSDRSLSAKLVPTFADRGGGESPMAVISVSRPDRKAIGNNNNNNNNNSYQVD